VVDLINNQLAQKSKQCREPNTSDDYTDYVRDCIGTVNDKRKSTEAAGASDAHSKKPVFCSDQKVY
tara:strand:- start:384 stop:581 length:198 start_codon:yes stop_codon:yes gene_type:complete